MEAPVCPLTDGHLALVPFPAGNPFGGDAGELEFVLPRAATVRHLVVRGLSALNSAPIHVEGALDENGPWELLGEIGPRWIAGESDASPEWLGPLFLHLPLTGDQSVLRVRLRSDDGRSLRAAREFSLFE